MSVPREQLRSAVQHFRENVQAASGRWLTIDALWGQLYHYYDFEFIGFDATALKRAIQSIGQTTCTVNGGNTTGFHTRSIQLQIGDNKKRSRVTFVYMCSSTSSDPIGGEPNVTEWRRIFRNSQNESQEYLRDIPSFVIRTRRKEFNEIDRWIVAKARCLKSPVQTKNVAPPEAIAPSRVSTTDSSPATPIVLDSPPPGSRSSLQEQDQQQIEPSPENNVQYQEMESENETNKEIQAINQANEINSPTSTEQVPRVVSPPPSCQGVRSNKTERLKYFLAARKRANASLIECLSNTELEQRIASASEGDDIHTFLDNHNQEDTSKWTVALEPGTLVFRSIVCTGEARSHNASRCQECENVTSHIHNTLRRALPLGHDNMEISPTTTHACIIRNPESTATALAQQSTKIRKLQQALRRQSLKQKLESEMIHVKETNISNEMMEAIPKVLEDAKNTLSESGKPEMVEMWQLMLDNLRKVERRKGEMRGIKFHAEILNFSLLLLAKTSHSTYNQVREVFRLPSLSYVLRKQKEKVGSQREADYNHGIVLENIMELRNYCEDHNIPVEQRLIAGCFDSVTMKGSLQWDDSGNMVGCDLEHCDNVVTNMFMNMAKSSSETDANDQQVLKGIDKLQDNMPNIAEHFLVFKASLLLPNHKISLVVARQGCKDIEPVRLKEIEQYLRTRLAREELTLVSLCGDGATENVKYFKHQATDKLSKWLSDEAKTLLQEANLGGLLDFKCVAVDPISGEPTFYLEDMPHIIKRIVNSMDRSANNDESRNLQLGLSAGVFDLTRIEEVWWACGCKSNQMTGKLTDSHFHRDNFSRMRVSFAVQVLSASVVRMIQHACGDKEVLKSLKRDAEFYAPLIQLATHVNNLVDIVNGRNPNSKKEKADFTPSKGRSIQKALVGILAWFNDWKQLNDRANLSKHAFLAQETWNGLQRMILGYIGIIDYYVVKKGVSIVPRRTLSDPCEHLFSRLRATVGGHNRVTIKSAMASTAKDSIINGQPLSSKASYTDKEQEKHQKVTKVEWKRRKRY